MNHDLTMTSTAPPMAPDVEQLLGFGTLARGFVSHNPHGKNVEFLGRIGEEIQELGPDITMPEGPKALIPPLYTVSLAPISPSPRKATTPPRGRPTRQMEGPITPSQMRELRDARAFAGDIGRPLLCPVDVNPWRLETPPEGDVGAWLRNGPLRVMAQFMRRQKDRRGRPIGWFGIATRENYDSGDGFDREHAHIVCHCPTCFRPKMDRMLDSAFPSTPGERAFMVHGDDLDAEGWDYRTKQMHAHAAGPPGPNRPTPERRHREEGWPVAPVLGKRIFVSRSIARPERTRAGWQEIRDEGRAVARVQGSAKRARLRSASSPVPIDATMSPAGIV